MQAVVHDIRYAVRRLACTRLDGAVLAPSIRSAVAGVDASVPVTRVDAMPELVSRSFTNEQFHAVLIGPFAVLAGMPAVVGIYGMTARTASRTNPAQVLRE